MDLQLILHNYGEKKEFFELSHGVRPWDIIIMISKGSFSLSFPNEDITRTFEPFEIAYIPANTLFTRKVIEPIDFHQFTFQINQSSESIGKYLTKGLLTIPKEHVKAIYESADRLPHFFEDHTLAKHLVTHILTENYIFSKGYSCQKSGLSSEIFEVIQYINNHLQEKIDIDELAKKVCLSHTGLIWKFKKELNVTPSDYLISARIHLAKQLLLENNLSIGEIATRCGYSDTYYFSNAFRYHTGVCPSKYRNSYNYSTSTINQ